MNKVLVLYERVLRTVGFEKLGNAVEILRLNGGPIQAVYKLFRFDDLKKGELVGIDEFGNRYYQNKNLFIGRSRWVEYADHFGLNYDASQIAPQWYGWIHYKTDYIPTEDPYRPSYPWMLQASENLTGTEQAYTPYSTVKPKMKIWQPKSKNT